jgi:L-rhamnose isomerase
LTANLPVVAADAELGGHAAATKDRPIPAWIMRRHTMQLEQAYKFAKKRYALAGIDTDAAIEKALALPISLHCWQSDDVGGFETKPEGLDGGGIMATGNYPGRARNGAEARADLAKAMSLIPGTQRVNVHACYSETDGFVDRDQMDVSCFSKWMDWAAEMGVKLDFNPTFFAHPKAEDGYTLSHRDEEIRAFWIRHGKACRKIAQAMAEAQGSPCYVNWWTPDGCKDLPADRFGPRARMAAAYDEIMADTSIDKTKCVDFIESKLFGIGSEEYVVSSAEFCSDYALKSGMGLCLDMGHYHPTETIHGKISSHLQFMDKLLLHVSRPIRWDSDHVVLFNDDLKNVFLEIQRGNVWNKVTLALDFFDASINRVGAYVIGTRAARKGILYALLDPTEELQAYESAGKNAQRLALMEAFKTMPFGAVWDMLCEKAGVPVGAAWLADMEQYESEILAARS